MVEEPEPLLSERNREFPFAPRSAAGGGRRGGFHGLRRGEQDVDFLLALGERLLQFRRQPPLRRADAHLVCFEPDVDIGLPQRFEEIGGRHNSISSLSSSLSAAARAGTVNVRRRVTSEPTVGASKMARMGRRTLEDLVNTCKHACREQ